MKIYALFVGIITICYVVYCLIQEKPLHKNLKGLYLFAGYAVGTLLLMLIEELLKYL